MRIDAHRKRVIHLGAVHVDGQVDAREFGITPGAEVRLAGFLDGLVVRQVAVVVAIEVEPAIAG